MMKIDRRNEMADLDDGATEGQMADYFAAELSGDNGEWNLGIVEYECPQCGAHIEHISDELANYNGLIKGWHDKAAEGDSFSRFIFQYLSFIAHLKNNLFENIPKDRPAIQALKSSEMIKRQYFKYINSHEEYIQDWDAIREELYRVPLKNSSRDYDNPEIDVWWNSSEANPIENDKNAKGVVHSLEDWGNMVEFWYCVRNNLFHGGKDPNIKRDVFLVEYAFRTLRSFMELELRLLN